MSSHHFWTSILYLIFFVFGVYRLMERIQLWKRQVLPVVKVLGRTDPLWKLTECLLNTRAAYTKLSLALKLFYPMSQNWPTSCCLKVCFIFTTRWYLQRKRKCQSVCKIRCLSCICHRRRSTDLLNPRHSPETNDIEYQHPEGFYVCLTTPKNLSTNTHHISCHL